MVEPQPSKLTTWVRFPSSAPLSILVTVLCIVTFYFLLKIQELKASDDDYQKIYEEISKNERKVMEKNNKEYYSINGENYFADNYERNLGIIIFENKTKKITYQLTYQKHNHKVLPYAMSDDLYNEFVDNLHKKVE